MRRTYDLVAGNFIKIKSAINYSAAMLLISVVYLVQLQGRFLVEFRIASFFMFLISRNMFDLAHFAILEITDHI